MSWWKTLLGLDRNRGSEAPDPQIAPAPEPVAAEPPIAFQPHNAIEQLLIKAAVDADARGDFHHALLEATLYAATPEAPEAEGTRMTERDEDVSICHVRAPDGNQIPAIFTAQERIVDVFGTGVGFIALKGEVLLSMLASAGAWLNPGFPYSVYWTADQMDGVLGRPTEYTVEKDTTVMLGTPSDPPTALIEALRDTLSRDSRIAEAWFALAHWPEEEKSTWYLDVRTELAAEDLRGLLDELFRKADFADRPLNMVVNKPGLGEGTGIRLVPVQLH